MPILTKLLGTLTLLSFLVAAAPAHSITLTWVGGAAGDWATAANWSPAQVPTSADLVFINTANAAITVPAGAQAARINSAQAGVTLSGGDVTLHVLVFIGTGDTLDIASDVTLAPSFNLFEVQGDMTITGSLTGSADFEKGATGTLSLEGNGTGFTGDIDVSEGTLAIGVGDSIGPVTTINLQAAATLDMEASETIGNLTGDGTVSISSELRVGLNNVPATFSGTLSGGAVLRKFGSSTFTLASDNSSYTGRIIVASGTLALESDLPAADIELDGTTVDVSAGPVSIRSFAPHPLSTGHVIVSSSLTLTQVPAGFPFSGFDLSGSGTVTVPAAGQQYWVGQHGGFTGTLQVGPVGNLVVTNAFGSGTNLEVDGQMDALGVSEFGSLTGTGTLVATGFGTGVGFGDVSSTFSGNLFGNHFEKLGSGTFTHAGTTTNDTVFVVNEGTFQFGGALSTESSLVIEAGATAETLGADEIGSLSGDGSLLLNHALSVGSDHQDSTFGGSITGSGVLTKAGVGALTLSGDNEASGFTGDVDVIAGSLVSGADFAFGTGLVTVDPSATLAGSGAHNNDFVVDGTIAPGLVDVAGTLALATLDMTNGSAFVIDRDPTDMFDLVTGTLNLQNCTVQVDSSVEVGETFDILSGSVTGECLTHLLQPGTTHAYIPGATDVLQLSRLLDTDLDGVGDAVELAVGTDPFDPDSDGDGLCDGGNTVGGTCTAGEDLNGDGILDPGESNPLSQDTDGDTLLDGFEVANGLDPMVEDDPHADPDLDGLDNGGEQQAGTLVATFDTDGDDGADGFEELTGFDPTDGNDLVRVVDDFDDNVADGWTQINIIGIPQFISANGMYRIISSPLVFGFNHAAGAQRSEVYAEFAGSVDIVDFNSTPGQTFALRARSTEGTGGSFPSKDGYRLDFTTSGTLELTREDSFSETLLGSTAFSINPGADYRMTFVGRGPLLLGILHEYPNLCNPVAFVSATDSTYLSGDTGLYVYDVGTAGTADVTFDNYQFSEAASGFQPAGDGNSDLRIDLEDLDLYFDSYGAVIAPGTLSDADGDGVVDEDDYARLALNFGGYGPGCDPLTNGASDPNGDKFELRVGPDGYAELERLRGDVGGLETLAIEIWGPLGQVRKGALDRPHHLGVIGFESAPGVFEPGQAVENRFAIGVNDSVALLPPGNGIRGTETAPWADTRLGVGSSLALGQIFLPGAVTNPGDVAVYYIEEGDGTKRPGTVVLPEPGMAIGLLVGVGGLIGFARRRH